MSGIVLSASVRQNLLSLQSTADLLATTQNRLATGKKVNTALDNPTNFFTAQSLDARAGDINNLLDGIGNGVQVLQAANTGITSLQKLVDTAKSIANQALQSAVGYSTKSNVSATIAGATATDLRGTTTYTSATATSNVLFSGAAGGTTAAVAGYDARRHFRSAGRHCRTNGAGTAASLAFGLTLAGAPSATTDCGQRRADRRRDLDRQRQDHHLQVGLGSRRRRRFRPAPASAAISSPTATATPPSTSAPPAPRRRRCSDLANAIDLASGVQKAVNAAGAATLSNSSGTNAAIAAGVLTLTTGTGCGPQHHRQGRPAECARSDRVGRLRRRHGHPAAHDHGCLARHAGPGRLDAERQRQDHHVQERRGSGWLRTFRPAQASAATSSPTATATRRSICRARRSPTR